MMTSATPNGKSSRVMFKHDARANSAAVNQAAAASSRSSSDKVCSTFSPFAQTGIPHARRTSINGMDALFSTPEDAYADMRSSWLSHELVAADRIRREAEDIQQNGNGVAVAAATAAQHSGAKPIKRRTFGSSDARL